ncbi:MAG: acetylxylan esterase [Candidatus Brocadiia bacterium]
MSEDTPALPDDVLRYLNRIYGPDQRRYACRATNRAEFEKWELEARPALRRLIGLAAIRDSVGDHEPSVEFEETIEEDGYTLHKAHMETEPDVRVPFRVLRPDGDGPFPLAVMPHGHNEHGFDTYAGIWRDEAEREHIMAEDRDVGVQAVRRGFLALTVGTRGIAVGGVRDAFKNHGGSDCRAHFMHAILAGRSSIGERVWDMERFIDWASKLDEVDPSEVLMMGNSGGGVLTLFAAACDVRVTIAVPSCSFAPYVARTGEIVHHDCNAVPGIMRFGEAWDVAGLIAPRHLLAVHGQSDAIRPNEEVDRATEELRRIYRAAGAEENFQQAYGHAGHRFYKDLMWPFIDDARR